MGTCSNLVFVDVGCLGLPWGDGKHIWPSSLDREDLWPPLEMEGSIISCGVAFIFGSLLDDECLDPIFDREDCLHCSCFEWETEISVLLEGTCSNLVFIDLSCLGTPSGDEELLSHSS